jgi:hypothetical protein
MHGQRMLCSAGLLTSPQLQVPVAVLLASTPGGSFAGLVGTLAFGVSLGGD